MIPLLTTITPYWGRPEALSVFLRSLVVNSIPEVTHLVIVVGDVPDWVHSYHSDRILIWPSADQTPKSIGYYHNLGARLATTDWLMKLDVDCIPHARYFQELLPVLFEARPREWFNGGMYYLDKVATATRTNPGQMPITVEEYDSLVQGSKLSVPAGTNFICIRQDYLKLGGCDDRFQGYGWEDYQQIYMLERHQQGTLRCPLPGEVTEHNVTQRCRDEISRRKAKELIDRNPRLGLLHRWHPPPPHGAYKNVAQTARNRRVLLDYITKARIEHGFGE